MDRETLLWLIGGAVGVIGGVILTVRYILNAGSRKERVLVVQQATIWWTFATLMVVGVMPWLPRPMYMLLYGVIMLVAMFMLPRLQSIQQGIRRGDICSTCNGKGVQYRYSVTHIIIAAVAAVITAFLAQREWQAHRYGGPELLWLRYGLPLAWVATCTALIVWLSYRMRRREQCGACDGEESDTVLKWKSPGMWPRIYLIAVGLGVVHGLLFESYVKPAHDMYDPVCNKAQRFIETHDWARLDAHSPRIENIEFGDLEAVAIVQAVKNDSGSPVRGRLHLRRENHDSNDWAISGGIEIDSEANDP